jgi:hypothetical protein
MNPGTPVGNTSLATSTRNRTSLLKPPTLVVICLCAALGILLTSRASAQTVPAGWTVSTIGTPAIAASATFLNGVFAVAGSGVGIGGRSDQFAFVHRPLTGDGVIVARVGTLTGVHSLAKAGVMIRESLAADARHAFVQVMPSNGVAFQRRIRPGGAAMTSPGDSGQPPVWLRVERQGSVFIASRSNDGSAWTEIDRHTISMGATTYVGLSVTSHDSASAAVAQFDNVTTSVGAVNNQPPYVSLTAPAANQTYTAPASIALTAAATDQDGAIEQVEFYSGSTRLGTARTLPYSITWSNVATGTYRVQAVARDNDGATTATNPHEITVTSTELPRRAVFTPSSNHDSAVDRYVLEVFPSGSEYSVSPPVATQDLGKPPVVNGECEADVSQTVVGLWPGAYYATVTALGPDGEARSAPSPTFAR